MDAIHFLDSEMSNSIMAGFTDLTAHASAGKGSYALAESAMKTFLRARRMVAKDMARWITNGVVADLVRYNYGSKVPCPNFTFGPLSEQNELAVLDVFKSVASTGANVDPEFYDELQSRVASLLELDEGKVKQSMGEGDTSPGSLQEMGKKVDIATQMVAGAQAAGQIPPSPAGPPPGGATQPAPQGAQSVVNSPAAAKKRTRPKGNPQQKPQKPK
jgi:hypothetical protein